ncbi:MAG: hypothetical protein V3U63_08195 [Gemmatimonadota bacterium]|nr:hypothetical protein [Candidatus Palauibacterales bacterium]
MKRSVSDVVLHGAIGGILTGGFVALWFLVLDVSSGQPMQTPATLAAALLGQPGVDASLRFIVVYSALHFAVFASLGVAAALFIAATGITPGWLVGIVFGIGVLDAVHYGALLLTGARTITVLPPMHVLAANLLGGVIMMTYLHRALRAESPLGFGALQEQPLLAKGLITGLVGAGAVALLFFVSDIIAGQPFRTPAALGSVILLGADSVADIQMNAAIVAAYTLIHLLVFEVTGVLLVVAARQLERVPGIWLILTLAFIILEAVSIPILGLLGEPVLGSSGVWEITLGNVIAVGSMGYWVWRTSPDLRRKLLEEPVATHV